MVVVAVIPYPENPWEDLDLETADEEPLHLRNRKFVLFLLSYRNTSEILGQREMLWEHEPQVSVSTAFLSSSKLSQVFL